jgi:hypothetical protein
MAQHADDPETMNSRSGSTTADRIIVRPLLAPNPSRRGWMVMATLWGWTLLWGVIYLLTKGQGPSMPATLPAWAGIAGVIASLVVPIGWRIPWFRSLYLQPHPMAVLDHTGIELHLPGIGVRRFAWGEIAALRPRPRAPAELLSTDGRLLAAVPGALVASGRPSLARSVVRVQPKAFEVTTSRFGRPNGGFARPRVGPGGT